MEHTDERVPKLLNTIGLHLMIKEHGVLSKLTLLDLAKVAFQCQDGLLIEAEWHGLSITALMPEFIEPAIKALNLFAEIVESR